MPTITTLKIITEKPEKAAPAKEKAAEAVAFHPPSLDSAPDPLKKDVERGHTILLHTRKTLPKHTGNELDCTNCHFKAGMTKEALSLVGVDAVYPKYTSGKKQPADLAMQTNACFERYLNAPPLPADSNDMLAILVYYRWISNGIPVDANVPWLGLKPIQSSHKPDVEAGKKLFSKCVPCHGQHGQGLLPSGAPPLWGDGAFPAGGGMGQVGTLAAFVHRLMPKGNPDLTVPEALDAAGYVLSHPRLRQKKEP